MIRDMRDPATILSTGDAAVELGRSRDRVRQLIVAGELPAIRTLGGLALVRLADVHAYLNRRKAKGVERPRRDGRP